MVFVNTKGQWTWMVVVGAFGAFGFGWGTGANDVANAFGTSVGSGALTNTQAIMIAAVFEFVGALVLGRVSTSVIAGSIADRNVFKSDPPVYAYGMMWTLWVGTLWLAFATYHGWNVSSTHSIIGGIIGFSLAYNKDGVLWLTEDPLSIPPYKGVVPIVIAWFFAPIATGLCSASLFSLIRFFVLRSEEAYERALKLLPLLVVITSWINIYFVFTKGAKKTLTQNKDEDWSDDKAAWIAFVVACGLGILSIGAIPFIRSRADFLEKRTLDKEEADKNLACVPSIEIEDSEIEKVAPPDDKPRNFKEQLFRLTEMADDAYNGKKDGKTFMEDLSEPVMAMRTRSETFDRQAENVFSVLQVFSACCVMFAHGAGEVGYMAGPLTTISEINDYGVMPKNVEAPLWIIFLSAISLVVGLATYGQRITRAMGKELCLITPSRGFAAELSTAVVIMVAAQYGLPTSSSQCITGGILGVGLVEGVNGVNWKLFSQTFASWVLTLFIMGIGTAALFAQGHAAP